MKIVLIGPTYPFRGGIAHYTTLLCRALRKQHEVRFISWSRQYPQWLFPGRSDRDPSEVPVTVDDVAYLIDSLNPLTWATAVRAIIAYGPDTLIFPWWTAFWTPHFLYIATHVNRALNTEIVAICHNVLEHESNPLKKMAATAVLAKADLLITHSRQDTKRLHDLLGNDIPIITAFHPTYQHLSHRRYEKKTAKKELGIAGSVLLFFGFIRDYKGLDVLLEALPFVLREQDVHLLIVGEFWKRKKKYLDQIRRDELESDVTIVDRYIPNEELALYFAAADVVVQPYLRASGSGICQLAFGFNRPVIATDVGSLSDVIEDTINGRIVAPGDSKALARAILESLEPDVLHRLSGNAVKTKERFSWGKMVEIVTGMP